MRHVTKLCVIDKAFAAFFRPFCRLLCPLRHPKYAEAFAEGLIGIALQCARFRGLAGNKSTLMMGMQTKVYAGCTTMAPHNLSDAHYKAVAPQLQALLSSGAINPNPDELKAVIRFLCYVYAYLDRYYVKCQKVPTIKKALMKAADAAGAVVEA